MGVILNAMLGQSVPPAPPIPQWAGYTTAIALMIAVAIASLIGSKRGHRD